MPIKSKEACEIASHLWVYICIFGPPQIILSDQGTEFCNKIVDSMLNAIGIEHSVTSGYNPRTNGMTERFNRTLIESLRKHAEMDVENWDKWIPYVVLSYNTRVHSVTGYSPYELLFGLKVNLFSKLSDNSVENIVLTLVNRANEVKNMQELRDQALVNISDRQVAQKAAQNNQNKISTVDLEKGTTVYVKREGLLGKLEPRYERPYRVVRKTSMGNYEVVDATDSAAKKTYPLHKLKVVEENEDLPEQSVEVKRILDHRKANKGFEYLVEWSDASENSWVHESNFNSVEVINEYKKRIREQNKRSPETPVVEKQVEKIVPKKRGRPRKSFNNLYLNPFL